MHRAAAHHIGVVAVEEHLTHLLSAFSEIKKVNFVMISPTTKIDIQSLPVVEFLLCCHGEGWAVVLKEKYQYAQ